jgi:hypothetical protein
MPLKDLAQFLAQRRASGLLNLERGAVRKQIELKDGAIVNASSNDPREHLGQFLINLGHISEEQFNKAYETQKETKIFLGKILVMTGSVKEETIHNALSLKFRETALEAYRWTEGNFAFDAERQGEALDGLDLTIDLQEVCREADFRETAWQAIRGVFASGAVKLLTNEENLPEPPKPGSLDAKLVELIKEGHTIDELALALHATDFFLYQRLYALYRLEAVRVNEEELLDDISVIMDDDLAGASVEELVAQVKAYVESEHWGDADELARRAHELAPSPETAALLHTAEGRLLDELRATFLASRSRPQLLVAPSKVKTMKLSAPERYLLSRFDGKRDLHSVVQVSPIRELDALKLIKEFVDAGLVEMKAG